MSEELSLERFVELLAQHGGPDFRGYKLGSLKRRIHKRLSALGLSDYLSYLQYIEHHSGEHLELLNTVLINVTDFFRDPLAWDMLRRQILPQLAPPGHQQDVFRAWCAGCATGEEAYSLALILAEHFGPEYGSDNVKIYATDIDEDALAFARRGVYPAERLRRVPEDMRKRYFTGQDPARISRGVRRMVIFGRSNLVTDAPISHVKLVICRNLLIYLDKEAQRAILGRLHYALEEGGILFMGKAESQLTQSPGFRVLNPRWRIFQKLAGNRKGAAPLGVKLSIPVSDMNTPENARVRSELASLQLQQRYLLETLNQGVLLLDEKDVVVNNNRAALRLLGITRERLAGQVLYETEIQQRCPELLEHVRSIRANLDQDLSFTCKLQNGGEERVLAVVIRAIRMERQASPGLIIYCDDVTHREQLQATVNQLESTSEELQSANEELETTNEELQSTNEELETTNEELQSTNEELETTNEELQSLNEELRNINDQLEQRTRDLNRVNTRFSATLDLMPWPVIVLDSEGRIQVWNTESEKMFGFAGQSTSGLKVSQLPIPASLISMIAKGFATVMQDPRSLTMKGRSTRLGSRTFIFDIRFSPIDAGRNSAAVLVTLINAPGKAKAPSVDGSASARDGYAISSSAARSSSAKRPAGKNKSRKVRKKA